MEPTPSGTASPREFEIKFDLGDGPSAALDKALAELNGKVSTKSLRATYFDTSDGVLAKAGFSLRLRDDVKGRVQTLKCADGAPFDRSEWESPAGGSIPDLDAPGFSRVRDLLEDAGPLLPRFANRVERRERTVTQNGSVIEIALDQGETEAGGRRAPLAELELELKAGDPAALFAMARSLSAAAPLRLSFETKAARGAALLSGEAPSAVKKVGVALEDGMTVGEAFAAVAGACLRQIVANERVLRLHRRPEALHQMRVGLRRLRSALGLFKAVCGDRQLERIKTEARWLTKRLDTARNLDVFIAETFTPAAHLLGEDDGAAALGRTLLRAQTRAYDRTLSALDTPRAIAFPLLLAEWLQAGDWTRNERLAPQRDEPVGPFAKAALDRLRRKVRRKSRGLAKLTPEARHKMRIAVKKLRYGLDFFAPLYPRRRVRVFGKVLGALQDSLGALNDIAVGRQTAAGLAGRGAGSGQVGFAAGLLVGLRARGEGELLGAAARQRQDLIEADPPWEA